MVKSTLKAVLVSFWPTEKPVRVPVDGFDIDCDENPFASNWGNTKKERERERAMYSDMVKDFTRDENGRFTHG